MSLLLIYFTKHKKSLILIKHNKNCNVRLLACMNTCITQVSKNVITTYAFGCLLTQFPEY